jgi:hypothetical protein
MGREPFEDGFERATLPRNGDADDCHYLRHRLR